MVTIPWPLYNDLRGETSLNVTLLMRTDMTLPARALVVTTAQAQTLTPFLAAGPSVRRRPTKTRRPLPARGPGGGNVAQQISALEARLDFIESPDEENEIEDTIPLPAGAIGWLGFSPVFVIDL